MPTLAQLADPGNSLTGYRDYQMACMEAGRTPLSREEWIKAGRPKQ